MRAEEKELDPALDLQVDHDKVEELEEERPPEEEAADARDVTAMHFYEVVAFIEGLMKGDDVQLEHLSTVSDHERAALRMIMQAIEGRNEKTTKSLFAEDRLEMLNQALAVLQPTLALGFEEEMLDARDLYVALVDDVRHFKSSLESLEDAEEEVFHHEEAKVQGKGPPKPPDAGEAGGDEPRPSQLATGGPAVPEKAPAPSTLATGPAAPDKQPAPSQLGGPGPAVEKPALPSTVYDGDDAGARRK